MPWRVIVDVKYDIWVVQTVLGCMIETLDHAGSEVFANFWVSNGV